MSGILRRPPRPGFHNWAGVGCHATTILSDYATPKFVDKSWHWTHVAYIARNFGVCGVEKVSRQVIREGIQVGRDHAARLRRTLDSAGGVRGKKTRTTQPSDVATQPADLVGRAFHALAPNRLWVAGLTYVSADSEGNGPPIPIQMAHPGEGGKAGAGVR